VEKNHGRTAGRTAGRTDIGVSDVQDAGVDLLQCKE
jgi:hypothetical protein